MTTYKRLFEEMVSFENLFRAANQSQRGKRMKKDVSGFNFQLENELIKLQDELKNQAYRPGAYRHFYVRDPKRRLISAAPYRDRVVHHAFCNIIEPLFDKTFIYHSYACRVGKGTHKALDMCQRFIGSNRYVLQCDISKYFSSIDHEILFSILAEKIKDEKVMRLAELIIGSMVDSPQSIVGKSMDHRLLTIDCGIPIGNLTSQFFANLYLNELDYFVKFDLREKCYIRYMDDFLIFGGNKEHLHRVKKKISHFLENSLKLSLHPRKSIVFPVSLGVDFCGFRVFKYYRMIRKLNIKLFKKKVKKMQKNFSEREITTRKVSDSIRAWVAHASHGNTYRLRKRVMEDLVFVRNLADDGDTRRRRAMPGEDRK